MNFNIFCGGTSLDLSSGKKELYQHPETLNRVVQVIRKSNADIVGLEEAEGNTERIAQQLNWYGSARFNIISRFPLWEGSEECVYVEVEKDRFLYVAVSHAPAEPYGPYLVRDGKSIEDIIELEKSFRISAIQPFIDRLPHSPLFLLGDFNSPSALDWTIEACKTRNLPFPIQWPMSIFLSSQGFMDTYRTIHPDPVSKSGLTWVNGSPESDPFEKEIEDRIDWILFRGNEKSDITIIDSFTIGGANADKVMYPWPSDHYAVCTDCIVKPIKIDKFLLSHPYKSGDINNLQPQIFILEQQRDCIRVKVKGGVGMRWDWIRIRCRKTNNICVYVYTGSISEGVVSICPPFLIEGNAPIWPLPLGEYDCEWLQDGGERVLASTDLIIN